MIEQAAPSTLSLLSQQLAVAGISHRLLINDNRHTMISIRKRKGSLFLSLHRIFLKAPPTVMQALLQDIRKPRPKISLEVKKFIDSMRGECDYSHSIDSKSLVSTGLVHDLKAIYDRLNRRYFQGELNLQITYFGEREKRVRSRCSLGLYYDSLKLIKIHRLLDNSAVPEYVIEFVVYHEMVHAVRPSHRDEAGIHRIHHAAFKEMEEQFHEYKEANLWIKKNKANFFLG